MITYTHRHHFFFSYSYLCYGSRCVHSYAQELPSRCKKEIVHAADINKDGTIDEEKLSTILYNIGASESLSKQDLRNIFQELGDSASQTISVRQMYDILWLSGNDLDEWKAHRVDMNATFEKIQVDRWLVSCTISPITM